MYLFFKSLYFFLFLSTLVIIGKPSRLQLDIKVTPPTCPGMCNGLVDLTVSGGQPGYTYAWSNGLKSEDYPNACAGSGVVIVHDAAGDSAKVNYTVTDPSAIRINNIITKQPTLGENNGRLEVYVSGGLLPYTFSIDGFNYSTSNIFSQLKPDYYVISIRDVNNCLVQSGTITLSDKDPIHDLSSLFNLYGNPENKDLHLYSKIPLSFILTDLQGRVVAEEESKTTHNIPIDSVAYGLYILKISDGEQSIYRKIAKTSE